MPLTHYMNVMRGRCCKMNHGFAVQGPDFAAELDPGTVPHLVKLAQSGLDSRESSPMKETLIYELLYIEVVLFDIDAARCDKHSRE